MKENFKSKIPTSDIPHPSALRIFREGDHSDEIKADNEHSDDEDQAG
jgi:hypothetical protein